MIESILSEAVNELNRFDWRCVESELLITGGESIEIIEPINKISKLKCY